MQVRILEPFAKLSLGSDALIIIRRNSKLEKCACNKVRMRKKDQIHRHFPRDRRKTTDFKIYICWRIWKFQRYFSSVAIRSWLLRRAHLGPAVAVLGLSFWNRCQISPLCLRQTLNLSRMNFWAEKRWLWTKDVITWSHSHPLQLLTQIAGVPNVSEIN